MSQVEPAKWEKPGWRIEQRYSPGVLIGNWSEERYSFQKANNRHNSTHRIDFKNYGSHRPDVVLRRKSQIKNEGLGAQLFYHHGSRFSNNLISWYDEHYNKKEREEWDRLPELRSWDSNQLSWVPEKSDYPMRGSATNFGLSSKLRQKWDEQIADDIHGDYNTTYRGSYTHALRDGLVHERYATPKERSTPILPVNKVNKDLHFRNAKFVRSPETYVQMPIVRCPTMA